MIHYKLFILAGALMATTLSAKDYRVMSPDGDIVLTVKVQSKTMTYDVSFKNTPVISDAPLSMQFSNGVVAGRGIKVTNSKISEIKEDIIPVVPQKRNSIDNYYRLLEIKTSDSYSILFRVYDDGVAYRFSTAFCDSVKVISEQIEYPFDNNLPAICGLEKSMFTHQEAHYQPIKLSEFRDTMIAAPPVIVTLNDNIRVLMTESDLESYGGIYFTSSGDGVIRAKFPMYVTKTDKTSDLDVKPVKRADYIASTVGKRNYPWRVMIITDRDADLAESDMIYKLASESRLDDTSWIKPGKVAWDWWSASRLYNVPFKSGINTETYKAYIDFSSKYGLEYIIIDDGWYEREESILKVKSDINIEEICAYGAQKNVGIILWTTWTALDERIEEAMDCFEKWGVKGLKIDFMQRDDQWMVDWYFKTAEKAANHHLMVMFHGCFHPTGLQRTFPNVMTFEAVKGLENMKWDSIPNPEHNATLPFTRMVQGPMDYTPGGMDNVHENEFKSRFNSPQTIGTRSHQLALYVVYESPLQMLADTPTAYEKEPVSLAFLKEVPSTWDKTEVIDGKIGEFIVTARKTANDWFLGAITNEAYKYEMRLDFLEAGKVYEMTCWEDGPNVDAHAKDVICKRFNVMKGDTITLDMYTGGGYVAIIRMKDKINPPV